MAKATLLYRIVTFPGLALLKGFDFMVSKFAVDQPVLNQSDITFNAFLRDNRLVFLSEYNNLLNAKKVFSVKDFYKVTGDLKQDENWRGAPLIIFNYLFKENSGKCPETIKLVKQLPGCCAAMFLVARPGKHIPPHRGVYKGVYRCLFTLQLPEGADCWIRVDSEKIYFREGETIIFDETCEHEVLNASDSERIVLSLDFYRKLPFPLNLLNRFIFYLLKNFAYLMILVDYKKTEGESYERFRPVISEF